MSITFLKFTTVTEVLHFLGLKDEMFAKMDKGANGYKQMLRCSENGMSILFDGGGDNMGIHVNIPGKAVTTVLLAFKETLAVDTPFGVGYNCWEENLFATFCLKLSEVGKFTRLDLAVDDFGGKYFKPQEVFDKFQDNCVVTKFRKCTRNDKYDQPQHCCGYTVYFGSRDSDIMLRIYDKKLEQNNKLKEENQLTEEWTRWELELKNERANQFAKEFSSKDVFGKSVMGVLSCYIRIIQKDNENKTRCSVDPVWSAFVNGVEKLRLTLKKEVRTLWHKLSWVESQVAPTLCALLISFGGDLSSFSDMLQENVWRISSADKEMLKREVPELYEQFFNSEQDEEWLHE